MAFRPSSKPHALVVPYPLQGHINPLMQLSQMLALKGFAITFVTTEFNINRMLQAHEKQTRELGWDIRLVGIPDGLPPHHDRKPTTIDFALSIDWIAGPFDELVQTLRRELVPITCIISDSFLPWTQDVANKWNIPRAAFWPNSLAVFACHSHVPDIISSGYNPFIGEEVTIAKPPGLVTCIPGLPPLHPADLPFKTLHGEESAQWLHQKIEEQFGRLNQARWIISNSFHELENQVCEDLQTRVPKMHVLGPLLPSAFLDGGNALDTRIGVSLYKEDECIPWLDNQPVSSVLYVSFGSIATLSAVQIQEMALGLVASKQPFLWVIRTDTLDDVVSNVLEALLQRYDTKNKGKVIQWAPQTLVLSHPAIGGFFSHCGWNSTLESISMGVPMIGWPQMMDQVTNCWFIVNKWRVGVELDRGEGKYAMPGRGEVEKAVRVLMQEQEGREMKRRASKLRDAARRAIKSSQRNLELLVDDIMQNAQGEKPRNT